MSRNKRSLTMAGPNLHRNRVSRHCVRDTGACRMHQRNACRGHRVVRTARRRGLRHLRIHISPSNINQTEGKTMTSIHACNCIGPQNGEPLCPCMMRGVIKRDGRYIRPEQDLGPVPDTIFGVPVVVRNFCPRCGIRLEGAMGYVCTDENCPTFTVVRSGL